VDIYTAVLFPLQISIVDVTLEGLERVLQWLAPDLPNQSRRLRVRKPNAQVEATDSNLQNTYTSESWLESKHSDREPILSV